MEALEQEPSEAYRLMVRKGFVQVWHHLRPDRHHADYLFHEAALVASVPTMRQIIVPFVPLIAEWKPQIVLGSDLSAHVARDIAHALSPMIEVSLVALEKRLGGTPEFVAGHERLLLKGRRVLLVDNFLRNGRVVQVLTKMIQSYKAESIGVFAVWDQGKGNKEMLKKMGVDHLWAAITQPILHHLPSQKEPCPQCEAEIPLKTATSPARESQPPAP